MGSRTKTVLHKLEVDFSSLENCVGKEKQTERVEENENIPISKACFKHEKRPGFFSWLFFTSLMSLCVSEDITKVLA